MTNQIAAVAPSIYARLSGQTGRGKVVQPRLIADYFIRCLDDYRIQLGMTSIQFGAYLEGKTVLEYGPGDILGTALLIYAHGASAVHCVDRFSIHRMTKVNVQTYHELINSLKDEQLERARTAINKYGVPESGLDASKISYRVTGDGLSGESQKFDLIVSRAVLEHVNNLPATFRDIKRALKPFGTSAHEVDLRSHGLDRYLPFDFLTWPTLLYGLMYKHKGLPNRVRLPTYRMLARSVGLEIKFLSRTGVLPPGSLTRIRPYLAEEFREMTDEDLACTVFRMNLGHQIVST